MMTTTPANPQPDFDGAVDDHMYETPAPFDDVLDFLEYDDDIIQQLVPRKPTWF